MKWKRRCELRQSQRTARLSIRKRMGLFHLSGTDARYSLLIRLACWIAVVDSYAKSL